MRTLGPREAHQPGEAEDLVARFLAANPSVSTCHEVRWLRTHRLRCRGWYRPHKTTILLDQLTRPGCGYSWPGHRSDRTLMGVVAHELGHHVHYCRPDLDPGPYEVPRERPVSGYEPDYSERVAETIRLFVLNPDLLARARPRRFAALRDAGLRPVEERGWREVLGPAIPARMLATLPGWSSAGALDGPAQQSLL